MFGGNYSVFRCAKRGSLLMYEQGEQTHTRAHIFAYILVPSR